MWRLPGTRAANAASAGPANSSNRQKQRGSHELPVRVDGLDVLVQRILTALVLIPLFLAALFGLSQRWWGVAMLAIVFLGALEWGRLIDLRRPGGVLYCAAVLGICMLVGSSLVPDSGFYLLCIALMLWLVVVPLWLGGRRAPSNFLLGASGIVILASAWYALFSLQTHAARLLALMCVVWIADSGAYFAGRAFGRRKLAPRISPGKTWEGVAGAAIGVALYYALVWWLWAPSSLAETRWLDLFVVLGMTALSIEGDLFESWLKRRAGVKDSGALLPGHGGVLDRIDGVVAALPFAALLTYAARG
jgi:phosphatidate cytidylyltransferase